MNNETERKKTKETSPLLLISNDARCAGIIRKLAGAHFDLELLAHPGKAPQVVARVEALKPNIVVFDTGLHNFAWAMAVSRIKHLPRQPAVIVVAMKDKPAEMLSAFREGADGYLLKQYLQEDFPLVLLVVTKGHTLFQREHMHMIRQHMLDLELGPTRTGAEVEDRMLLLTDREKELFPLLADGKSIKEISRIVGISNKTVETHKYHIMEKLNARNMTDLTKMAISRGIVTFHADAKPD